MTWKQTLFFKRPKWNILSKQNVLPSTRSTKENMKSMINIYKQVKEKTTKNKQKK